MFQTGGYPAHPPHFSHDYRTFPRTPQQTDSYEYYSPRQYVYTTPPSRRHTRRATGDTTTYNFTSTARSSPQKSQDYDAYFSSPAYHNYSSAQSTPQRKPDYVSGTDRRRERARYVRVTVDDGKRQRNYSSRQYYSPRSQYVYDEHSDPESEYLPRYEQYEPQPPPYHRRQSHPERRADTRYYDQVPIYTAADTTQPSRPRRASYTAHPTQPPPRRRASNATKSPPRATEEDARRHDIPAGYSIKNWDPTEEPILLLGSVFDANSLGKWIYDWTVFYYGPATPMSEVAGELWLLLIQLAGKIKRAEEAMSRIRRTVSRDLVDEFLESGERLWQRFNKLLKICESYMWRAAKKESHNAKKVTMGENSGCEFVDSIFGRDRELERTEKLMTGMRLWSMRFDANCEEILRNPGA